MNKLLRIVPLFCALTLAVTGALAQNTWSALGSQAGNPYARDPNQPVDQHTWLSTQTEGWWRMAFDQLHVPYAYINTQDVAHPVQAGGFRVLANDRRRPADVRQPAALAKDQAHAQSRSD